jgi:formate dehydrogenase
LSAPGGTRLATALRSLELCVSVDIYRNETSALAHWTLPSTDFLEREDFPLIQSGMQPEPYTQATPAVAQPRGERRTEAEILVALARAAGLKMFRAPGATTLLSRVKPERVLRWVSRAVGIPFSRAPIKLAADEPGAFLRAVPTKDGRVDVAPAEVMADVPRAAARCKREATEAPPLRLIGRRQRRSHNSWMNGVSTLRKSDDGCRLAIHPDDAARLGVTQGARVAVSSAAGRVEVHAQLDDKLMPGTVSMPHGWSTNVNLLAADGPAALEPLSGMARYNGIEVDVTPIAN